MLRKLITLILSLSTMTACSTPQYKHYEGADFAIFTITNTAVSTTNVFEVDISTCPEPKTSGLAHLEGNSTLLGRKGKDSISTTPIRIQANKRFYFDAITGGTYSCSIGGYFVPKQNHKYTMLMDSEGNQCSLSIKYNKDGKDMAEETFVPVRARYFADLCRLQ
jgi:hypothetical protein